jgi:hypothetical protein
MYAALGIYSFTPVSCCFSVSLSVSALLLRAVFANYLRMVFAAREVKLCERKLPMRR